MATKKDSKGKNSKGKNFICEYTCCTCKKAKCENIDVKYIDCDDCPIFEDVAIGEQW